MPLPFEKRACQRRAHTRKKPGSSNRVQRPLAVLAPQVKRPLARTLVVPTQASTTIIVRQRRVADIPIERAIRIKMDLQLGRPHDAAVVHNLVLRPGRAGAPDLGVAKLGPSLEVLEVHAVGARRRPGGLLMRGAALVVPPITIENLEDLLDGFVLGAVLAVQTARDGRPVAVVSVLLLMMTAMVSVLQAHAAVGAVLAGAAAEQGGEPVFEEGT